MENIWLRTREIIFKFVTCHSEAVRLGELSVTGEYFVIVIQLNGIRLIDKVLMQIHLVAAHLTIDTRSLEQLQDLSCIPHIPSGIQITVLFEFGSTLRIPVIKVAIPKQVRDALNTEVVIIL